MAVPIQAFLTRYKKRSKLYRNSIMLVITRTNLAQSFKAVTGKNGKATASAKRIASVLSSVSAAQALYLGLTGGAVERKTLLSGIDSFSIGKLCALERVDYGSLFAALSSQWGYSLDSCFKGQGATQCARLLEMEQLKISELRILGDANGYAKGQADKLRAREDVADMVSEALDKWRTSRDAAMALKALQNSPLSA
jgi:hypothetical protein